MVLTFLRHLTFVLTLALISLSAAQAEDAALTDFQKKDVISVLEQHLKDNPKLVIDAIEAYQEQERLAAEEKSQKSIEENLSQLSEADLPFVGNKDGDVTVVEFFDYNCGYCKRAVPDIRTIIKDDKNVRFVFKEMPILGPSSRTAAQYALAAHKQGQYFEYHAALMEHRGPKDEATLEKLAKDLGLDPEQMRNDANSPEVDRDIEDSINLAGEIGIRGTPAFIVNGKLFRGYLGREGLKLEIENARGQ